ncbi:hypothetical protein HK099_008631 [Clydaea vesicula]|uniref:Glycosyltransferase family 28 N-terminal domain-containing protein n=1 Tax=Clydaea vesicula TaxID=447962 RepID=A0AAD5TVU4_9FUNG|nr:hypothetical protein HK099_008631 [Clydaea vesicula]
MPNQPPSDTHHIDANVVDIQSDHVPPLPPRPTNRCFVGYSELTEILNELMIFGKYFQSNQLHLRIEHLPRGCNDFIDFWLLENPSHQIVYVGESTVSSMDSQDFCLQLDKQTHEGFMGAFLELMVNEGQIWKTKISKSSDYSTDQNETDKNVTKRGNEKYVKNLLKEQVISRPETSVTASTISLNKSLKYEASFKKGKLKIDVDEKNFHLLEDDRKSIFFEETFNEKKFLENIKQVELFKYEHSKTIVPFLNILILIVGSRGDVQPFVALGKELLKYGHRVRLATHETFRNFVNENGLEFYPLAGDPAELMAYMVKNPGLIPGMESVKNGEIGKKKEFMAEVLKTSWSACIEPDDRTGKEFIAQAIIANPPSFAHIHCAEKLSIPLHIYFTTKTLDLPSLSATVGPLLLHELEIPHTYCWSPNLIKKPGDWGEHIDISGFFFLDLATNYTPPQDLQDFLNAGPAPVYIGFGSIVVDDPDGLTKIIFAAVKKAGLRAIVSKGWGGLGGEDIPSNIFMIGNCPHDWLFEQVSAVIHHGGAGTTAAGLLKGKPTGVVPFFGDQPFWGAMIHRMKVGPAPIPHKSLNEENLSAALKILTLEETKKNAFELGKVMKTENGVDVGVKSFHRHLPISLMKCDLQPTKVAEYFLKGANLKLSGSSAEVLIEKGRIALKDLIEYKYKTYDYLTEHNDIISGAIGGSYSMATDYFKGLSKLYTQTAKGIKKAQSTDSHTRATYEITKGVAMGVGNSLYFPLRGVGKFLGQLGDGARNTTAFIDSTELKKEKKKVDGVGQGLKYV